MKDMNMFLTLLVKAYDGTIDNNEQNQLNHLIQTDEQAARLCVEFFDVVSNLIDMEDSSLSVAVEESSNLTVLMSMLGKSEQEAPAINIVEPTDPMELIQKVQYVKPIRKISRTGLFVTFASMAAMLLVLAYAYFVPAGPYNKEVATVIDQIDTRWSPQSMAPQNGARLWTNEGLLELEKGIVKIQYDNGVDVLVEGPAGFEIDRFGVYLDHGRLFSRVSQSGLGFTVNTRTCQFIDHGTEFGVQSGMDGSSELHVMKGKVQLFASPDSQSKTGQMVTEDHAAMFNAQSGSIRNIELKKAFFVRQIDSKRNIRWRGETIVDLADIVGGGNGRGTGTISLGIDMSNGQFRNNIPKTMAKMESTDFIETNSPYIDGVFVPSQNKMPLTVSSQGHVCAEKLNTDDNNIFMKGVYCENVFKSNNSYCLIRDISSQTIYPAIFMHSNQGLTFSLEAIRKAFPEDMKIQRFSSKLNMPVRVLNDYRRENKLGRSRSYPEVDVYVLLDGKARFQRVGVHPDDGVISIDVEITPQDRFLTLMVTSGGGTDFDWTFFTQPHLELVIQ